MAGQILLEQVRLKTLGRRQVVRHRLLVPTFVGSNPAAPANRKTALYGRFFYWLSVAGEKQRRWFDDKRKRDGSIAVSVANECGGTSVANGNHESHPAPDNLRTNFDKFSQKSIS